MLVTQAFPQDAEYLASVPLQQSVGDEENPHCLKFTLLNPSTEARSFCSAANTYHIGC